jgi:hypothetical protein
MALAAGTRLGPYEILSLLGAGGMGEVYRARDSKLDRDVAVKVLPADLPRDKAALARFEREAKAVAALSHQIGRLFGLHGHRSASLRSRRVGPHRRAADHPGSRGASSKRISLRRRNQGVQGGL